MSELIQNMFEYNIAPSITDNGINIEYLVCKVCNECFTCNSDLINHVKIHNIKIEQMCVICGQDYQREIHVLNHMLIHKNVLQDYHRIFLNQIKCLNIRGKTTTENNVDILNNKGEKENTENCALKTGIYFKEENRDDIKSENDDLVEFDIIDVKPEQDSSKEDDYLLFPFQAESFFQDSDDDILLKHFKTKRNPKNEKQKKSTNKDYLKILSKSKENVKRSKSKRKRRNKETDCDIKIKLKRMFECDHCPFVNETKRGLKRHMKDHSAVTLASCDKCHFTTDMTGELAMHKLIHKVGQLFQCNECNYKTSIHSDYKFHLKLHNELAIFCHICNITFKRAVSLKEHMKRHRMMQKYKCDMCPSDYKDEKNLKRHMQEYHDIKVIKREKHPVPTVLDGEVLKFKCEQCNYTTKHKCCLTIHAKKHDNEYSFYCDQCNFRAGDRGTLKRHLLVHQEKSIFCEVCGKAFRIISNLTEHLRSHSQERTFRCDKCPQSYKDRKSLKRHFVKVHDQSKSLKCEHCSFTADTQYYLKRHLRKHSPEDSFHCNKCTFSCRGVKALKSHYLTHMNYPLFSCPHCEYKSVSERAVKLHMGRHKDDPTVVALQKTKVYRQLNKF